jgi:hypothetical protein
MIDLWPSIYENVSGFVSNPLVRLLMIPSAAWLILHASKQVQEAETKALREETAKREEYIAPLLDALIRYSSQRRWIAAKDQLRFAQLEVRRFEDRIASLGRENQPSPAPVSQTVWEAAVHCLAAIKGVEDMAEIPSPELNIHRPPCQISTGGVPEIHYINRELNKEFFEQHEINALALRGRVEAAASTIDEKLIEAERAAQNNDELLERMKHDALQRRINS